MIVRRWIGTLALGLAVALPSTGLATQDTTKDKAPSKSHGAATKAKGSTHKAADKTAKAGGKTNSGGDDAVTDSWITMKIKADFVKENTLKGSDINVETKDKVVTLKGTVVSDAGKARAEQIAKATQGVTRVVDNLIIRGK